MTRTVVVTGGGTGIGRAVAAAFVADDAQVVIAGRREDVLREAAAALRERAVPIVCDSTDPDQLEVLRDKVPGPVHVLVNNAGGNQDFTAPPGTDMRTMAARWRANLESNLISAVLTTAALQDHLAAGGAVINVGSFATDRGAGSYGAAKAALASWNITLAKQLGARDITCNVVSPGYVVETQFFGGRVTPEFHDARVAETMIGRAGRPQDVADVVRFLASPAARHITGQVIHVNGGALTTR